MQYQAIRRAYTLIELLIVVALLGLAGAIIVPQINGRDSLRVQAAVRKLIGDVSFAQSDALAHQEYRRIHFYDDGSGYCIYRVGEADFAEAFDADTADFIVDPTSSSGGAGGFFITDFSADNRWSDVEVVSVDLDSGGRDLIFDALGGTVRGGSLPGIGGTIRLGAGADIFEVTVAPFTGKLSVARVGS